MSLLHRKAFSVLKDEMVPAHRKALCYKQTKERNTLHYEWNSASTEKYNACYEWLLQCTEMTMYNRWNCSVKYTGCLTPTLYL